MEEVPEKWVSFYEPFFDSKDQAYQFVAELECLCPDNKPHPAKVMMHQVQRLVSLADDLPKIRKGNETLPMLFLLVCAEHIAKIFHGFNGEGQSKTHVKKFFSEFLSDEDTAAISSGITSWERKSLSVEKAVTSLYEVRCDVVHEGRYWGFHFAEETPMLNSEPNVVVNISLQQFRAIVVRGAIRAIQQYAKKP